MSLKWRIVYSAIIGAWGGFLAWLLTHRLGIESNYLRDLFIGPVTGLCIGGLLGLIEGLMSERYLRSIGWGIAIGAIGGAIGLLLGEFIYQAGGKLSLFRAIGYAIFGIGIGVTEGIIDKSIEKKVLGIVGGGVGGFLGGLCLEGSLIFQLRATSTAVSFSVLGAMIGLFISLLPLLLRRAWVVIDQRREYIISNPVVTVGSAQSCNIYLRGDDILPVHAKIHRRGADYFLEDAGSEIGTLLNNKPVEGQQKLRNDVLIRIGQKRPWGMLFMIEPPSTWKETFRKVTELLAKPFSKGTAG